MRTVMLASVPLTSAQAWVFAVNCIIFLALPWAIYAARYRLYPSPEAREYSRNVVFKWCGFFAALGVTVLSLIVLIASYLHR